MNEELLLYTTYDSFAADQILALLKTNDIPAFKREHGAGQMLSIFMGSNFTQGIDIYIPASAEDAAVDLMVEAGYLTE